MFSLPSSLALLLIPAAVVAQSAVTDYAPTTNAPCPDFSSTSLIREFTPQNQTLHPREEEYVNTRRQSVLPNEWREWLGNGYQMGYQLASVDDALWPNVGIALPGGGLRAAQVEAGLLSGLDRRNETAKLAGTGGLLQVASYMAGLSGGSWVLGSLLFNDFPTIHHLVLGNGNNLDGWKLDIPFVTPDGDNIFSDGNQAFYGSILSSITAKGQTGIDTSLADPWARAISYHFLNGTTRSNFFTNDSAHGAGQLWSKIPEIPAYQQYLVPFPIAVADSRPAGSTSTSILELEATVYEITPMELASYDPNLSAGMNLTYAGTHLTNGRAENGTACTTGFDQAGFVMGSSATVFNQVFDLATSTIKGMSQSDSDGLLYILARQVGNVRQGKDDVANWPNPFHGMKPNTFQDTNSSWLELIDGSANQENIPFAPLFVRERSLDVIVTLEASSDFNNFSNGSALIFSSRRQASLLQSSHQRFPPIPDTPEDFIATGVNARTTFFGCDPATPNEYPLIILLPNAPPIDGSDPITNTPTFQLEYTLKHTELILESAQKLVMQGFTPNANTPDPNFGICLQCAAFDRARMKATPVLTRSEICSNCFKQYCYDPKNPPSKSELPNRKSSFVDPDPQGLSNFLAENKFSLIGGLVGLVVLIGLVVGGFIFLKKKKEKQFYHRLSEVHHNEAFTIPPTYGGPNGQHEIYELPQHRGQL